MTVEKVEIGGTEVFKVSLIKTDEFYWYYSHIFGNRPVHCLCYPFIAWWDKSTPLIGVGVCLRALERRTIIVSICSIACSVRSNLEVVCNLIYSVCCYRRWQWCICVLSSTWWSGLAEPWPSTVYFWLVKINYVYKAFSCVMTQYKPLPKWLRHVNQMWYELNEHTSLFCFGLHPKRMTASSLHHLWYKSPLNPHSTVYRPARIK